MWYILSLKTVPGKSITLIRRRRRQRLRQHVQPTAVHQGWMSQILPAPPSAKTIAARRLPRLQQRQHAHYSLVQEGILAKILIAPSEIKTIAARYATLTLEQEYAKIMMEIGTPVTKHKDHIGHCTPIWVGEHAINFSITNARNCVTAHKVATWYPTNHQDAAFCSRASSARTGTPRQV